jgi:hypothetical protein
MAFNTGSLKMGFKTAEQEVQSGKDSSTVSSEGWR